MPPPERRCNTRGLCIADDDVPPAAPTDLTATTGDEPGTLALRFTAPGDNGDGGAAADRYLVLLQPRPEGAVLERPVERAPQTPGLPELIVVRDLPAASAFVVQLEVADDADNRVRTSAVEARTLGDIPCVTADPCLTTQICGTNSVCVDDEDIPPGTVDDVRPVLARTTLTSFTVQFTAPGDDGFDVDGAAPLLTLRAEGDDGSSVAIELPPATALALVTATIDGLQRGTVYTVRVDAADVAGNTSAGAPVIVETGGVACRTPDADGTFVIRGDFVATLDEQLVRLMGCEVLEGSLDVDARDCRVSSLRPLSSLRSVSGALLIGGNPLCTVSPRSLDGLEALTDSGSLIVTQIDLETAVLPRLTSVEELLSFASLPRLGVFDLPVFEAAEKVEPVFLPALDSVTAPALASVRELSITSAALRSLSTPELVVGRLTVEDAPALTGIAGLEAGNVSVTRAPSLTTLALPARQSVDLREVSLATFTNLQGRGATIFDCPNLVELTIEADLFVTIVDNPALTRVTLIAPFIGATVRGNGALPTAGIVCRAGGAPGNVVPCPTGLEACGNADDAPCP